MCKRSNYPKYLQKRHREHPATEWSARSMVVTGKSCPRLLPTQAHLDSGPPGRFCSDISFVCQTLPALPHPSPSEAPAGLPLPHSHSRVFPASLARSLTVLHQIPVSPSKAVAQPSPPLLLPGRGPGRDSRRSCSECGRTFWSYSCRTDPDAAGSQEAIGQRLILQSQCGSV